MPETEAYTTEPIQAHLVTLYFSYIDPLLPILHKPSFYSQLESGQQISDLLLNSIYCVSSRWDLNTPVQDQPRGWSYYKRAISLLENQPKVQLTTVQSLVLLLKYNEHIRRSGFLWRMRCYFQMVIRMCKDLGLEQSVFIEVTAPEYAIELEKRRRTFWAIYCYDVMMSIEYGIPPQSCLENDKIMEPQLLYEEDQKKVIHFSLLTKIMCCQAQITSFLKRKLDPRSSVTNFLIKWNEQENFSQLTRQLKKSIAMVFSLTQYSNHNNMSYAVCFLSLACYYAIITLHRPFGFQTGADSEVHTQYCIKAAYSIQNIITIIFENGATEDMYCSMRGIPQILQYLSAAATIFKESGHQDELNSLLLIIYHLASISPMTEMSKIKQAQILYPENRLSLNENMQDLHPNQPMPHILNSLYHLYNQNDPGIPEI